MGGTCAHTLFLVLLFAPLLLGCQDDGDTIIPPEDEIFDDFICEKDTECDSGEDCIDGECVKPDGDDADAELKVKVKVLKEAEVLILDEEEEEKKGQDTQRYMGYEITVEELKEVSHYIEGVVRAEFEDGCELPDEITADDGSSNPTDIDIHIQR